MSLNEGWKYLNVWCGIKYDYISSLDSETFSAFTKPLEFYPLVLMKKCCLEQGFSFSHNSGISWKWVIVVGAYNDQHWTNVKNNCEFTVKISHIQKLHVVDQVNGDITVAQTFHVPLSLSHHIPGLQANNFLKNV